MNAITSVPVRRRVQTFLKHIGLYERLKASRIYDFYWSFAGPQWIIDRAKEVEFYRKTLAGLEKGDLIFDIGANEGWVTDVFLRLGARIVAVEPDETNADLVKGKFLRNRIFPKPVKVENKAVSDKTGEMTMWIESANSALNTLNAKWADTLRHNTGRFGQPMSFAIQKSVKTTTLEDLISEHGSPFFIKIDVEGHEMNVLRGLRRPVPYLSFEVNLPEFEAEGVECINMLEGLKTDGLFNYTADIRRGLAFERWLPRREFLGAFERCEAPAIEIFWRTRV